MSDGLHAFLVTGSARLDVYRRGGDSLMERYHYWRLHPFTLDEIPRAMTPSDAFKRLMTVGGLIRSAGGWVAVKALIKMGEHVKSDERILGDGTFVEDILSKSQEAWDQRHQLKSKGVDVNDVAARVALLLNMKTKEVWLPGKYKRQVIARSLLCFWAVRELGESMTSMALRLNISTAAVSKAVVRGGEIAKKSGYRLILTS